MSVSSIFQTPYFWGGSVVVVTAVVLVVRSRPVQVRAVWSRLSLRLPVVKGFILKAEIARMARTLQLLLQAGIPILKALEITSPVMRNVVLRETFDRAREEVRGGESLGKTLRASHVFPLFMTNLFSVGEESGKIEEALDELSGFYERETDEAIKVMTSLLEPLMILVMGALVGFIVIAMLLPMFELNMMVK
jgi:type II secretory pathway component PulF